MKKFLSLVLALVMTMSLVTVSAGAKDFSDSTKIQYKEAVDVMSAVKVIDGYADGSFNPSATLTRGAAAKIICNLILGPTTASALVADAAPYIVLPYNRNSLLPQKNQDFRLGKVRRNFLLHRNKQYDYGTSYRRVFCK